MPIFLLNFKEIHVVAYCLTITHSFLFFGAALWLQLNFVPFCDTVFYSSLPTTKQLQTAWSTSRLSSSTVASRITTTLVLVSSVWWLILCTLLENGSRYVSVIAIILIDSSFVSIIPYDHSSHDVISCLWWRQSTSGWWRYNFTSLRHTSWLLFYYILSPASYLTGKNMYIYVELLFLWCPQVFFIRISQFGALLVSNTDEYQNNSNGTKFQQLEIKFPLYLGGVPDGVDTSVLYVSILYCT